MSTGERGRSIASCGAVVHVVEDVVEVTCGCIIFGFILSDVMSFKMSAVVLSKSSTSHLFIEGVGLSGS